MGIVGEQEEKMKIEESDRDRYLNESHLTFTQMDWGEYQTHLRFISGSRCGVLAPAQRALARNVKAYNFFREGDRSTHLKMECPVN